MPAANGEKEKKKKKAARRQSWLGIGDTDLEASCCFVAGCLQRVAEQAAWATLGSVEVGWKCRVQK